MQLHFRPLVLLRFWKYTMRAFERYTTWWYYEKNIRILIWRQTYLTSYWDSYFFFKIWKLSLCTFRITIETGSENEVLKTYFRFSEVTWPAQKWGIVTREVCIVRKSFYIQFRWENRGFVGFLFIFLPKFDRKVVKNEKNQKKAIAFFSEDVRGYLKNG